MSVSSSSPAGIEKSCVEGPEDLRDDDANKEMSWLSGSSPDRSAIQRV